MTHTVLDGTSAPREVAAAGAEPEALAAKRASALEAYSRAPLPARVHHLWRYSDPAWFLPPDASAGGPGPADAAASPAASPAEIPHLEAALASGDLSGVVLDDGSGSPRVRLSRELQSQGVSVLDLREAFRREPALVEGRLGALLGGTIEPDGRGKFEALNLARWRSGVFVRVPRNVRVERPLQIWHSFPAAGGPRFTAVRVLTILEEGAELTLLEEAEGGSAGSGVNAVCELFAGPASRLRHAFVHRLGPGVNAHLAQRVSAGRDANALTALASLGGARTKADFGARLDGPGANVELYGFLLGEAKQHFDHHTLHDHRAGHTHSNLDFKVVLKGRALSAYTGLIRIEPDAPGSEAYQENRNLLLEQGTKAESIPELEILTDDVRCTHGATVGSLDPEHLFYLMCRGVPRREAIRLIVGGFVEPTLSRLPETVRDRLAVRVEELTSGM